MARHYEKCGTARKYVRCENAKQFSGKRQTKKGKRRRMEQEANFKPACWKCWLLALWNAFVAAWRLSNQMSGHNVGPHEAAQRGEREVCVQCGGTGGRGGLSADCHVEARRTPELIYYFNSRSKCLPFVCSCFTISAECRVINDASLWGLPLPSLPPLPQLLPLYHIMRKHGVVNRFSNAASIGICVYFGRGEKEKGREWGHLIFIRLLWHHLTQFPFCWTNLVSEHKFMCMQDEG